MIANYLINEIKNDKIIRGINNRSVLSFQSLIEEALYISFDYINNPRCIVVVKENNYVATKLYERIQSLIGSDNVLLYVPEESLRVEAIASSPENKAQRIETMYSIIENDQKIIITSSNGIVRNLPNKELFKSYCLEIKKDEELSINKLRNKLIKSGYNQVARIDQPLCFSIRGGVVDIYSINYDYPIRVEFFDTIVDSIRFFDIHTQRTKSLIDKVNIIPATDILFSDEDILDIEQNVKLSELESDLQEVVSLDMEYLKENVASNHLYIYNSFKTSVYGILDYLDNPLVILSNKDKIEAHLHQLMEETVNYIQEMANANKMILKFNVYQDLNTCLKHFKVILNDPFSISKAPLITEINMPSGNLDYIMNIILQDLEEYKIILSLKDNEIKEVLDYLIKHEVIYNLVIQDELKTGINIISEELYEGFEIQEEKIIVYSSYEIFKKKQKVGRYANKYKESQILQSYEELNIKDYVVHNQHGIGQYMGIVTKEFNGIHRDYLQVIYKDNDELLVPLEQFSLVRKFVSREGLVPKLHKLGTTQWEKTKQKLQENVQDIAQRLVALYATREENIGYAYSKDTKMQLDFEEDFEYELTPDQTQAVIEIKKDMESSKPMDRLLCGDVGFGKTEVAARAAFKAVIDHKQVAFLCPTTILSLQHYKTFIDRCKNYPIRIEVLNRFILPSKQKEILKDLKEGKIDIIIGTHRILSKDIKFKDLGFLIIDEEQRFGVEHKEKIKELKETIDVLSLSATPIPRTLQMSLIGIRQLSTLDTPPNNRMPVQTYVVEKTRGLIIEAIQRELQRDGQVFYLYNNIGEIYNVARMIQREIKEAKVSVAHGKMSRDEIEDVMIEFNENKTNVLICTTIIETGIDIPNANTILIENANNFGLSQLYQIKGRVGRSDRVAYAYLMIPSKKQISEIATKRLNAIKEFTELGSGYKIAMRDLTIRGAGDLLGPNQSGFIDTVGIDMYIEMLDEAIKKEKGIALEAKQIVKRSNVQVDGYIPTSYAPLDYEKIGLYKRIDMISSLKELNDFQDEISDQHGKMPNNVKLVFEKKELDLLINDPYVEFFKDTPNAFLIKFQEAFSNVVDGIKLFEVYNKISKDITLSYANNHINVKIPKGKNSLDTVIRVLNESKGCLK